ncbi:MULTISPECIES: hypothetical protein [Gracilibacillus]|uniref:hypothetical protein n=1 Tax=Gracilibacillus TaxID=74385 RepID=UPI000824B510|nr:MULTISPECIES: hypothetical protein [Gracilibacillus]
MGEKIEKRYSWVSYTFLSISSISLVMILLMPSVVSTLDGSLLEFFLELTVALPFVGLFFAGWALFRKQEAKGWTIFGLCLAAGNFLILGMFYYIIATLQDIGNFLDDMRAFFQ